MRPLCLLAVLLAACTGEMSTHRDGPPGDGGSPPGDAWHDVLDAPTPSPDAPPGAPDARPGTPDARPPVDAPPCRTRITYGSAWIHPDGHPAQFDETAGLVTWDGACTDDGTNSYATLSNGWKPYFSGHGACVIALDAPHCAGAPTSCETRLTYGAAWQHPDGHPAQHDDVADRVTWDGVCVTSGETSYATLSNGWAPHFTGAGACSIALRYTSCGGLYLNPVGGGCADPGVLRVGDGYLAACTSGNAAAAFPILASSDLVHWSAAGHVFPSGSRPSWAVSDFWAPELHRVGTGYVAYFTARHSDGKLSVGAATSATPTGPYADRGAPLVHDASMGMIDATYFEAADGSRYLVWKADGNAVGQPTPIYGQRLAADGLSLTGGRVELIRNDRTWEGGVVEGPWVVRRGGTYTLFYSGNAYYNGTYAVGVAQAAAPLGPYTKASGPIVVTNGAWVGPGHNSTVDTPGGDTYLVYHAWQAGHVNGPGDARLLLLDRVIWGADGWPKVPESPSWTSRPMP